MIICDEDDGGNYGQGESKKYSTLVINNHKMAEKKHKKLKISLKILNSLFYKFGKYLYMEKVFLHFYSSQFYIKVKGNETKMTIAKMRQNIKIFRRNFDRFPESKLALLVSHFNNT